MATTDTRSGFRLPWSSDRSQESTLETSDDAATAFEGQVAPGDQTAEAQAPEGLAWPSSDFDGRPAAASPAPAPDPQPANEVQEPAMIDTQTTSAAPPTPRKPSKLMAELAAAIRTTAETARDQALSQVDADVAAVVEQIRTGAREGEDALRVHADDDIAGIKEWSRAEIARIKQETDQRIDARKLGLDEELAAHAAAIEQRVSEVEDAASAYRAEMDAYAERLGQEEDPARLATMAESMPEAPALDGLADVADLELDLGAAQIAADAGVLPADEAADRPFEGEADLPAVPEALAEPITGEAEAVIEPAASSAEMAEPEPEALTGLTEGLAEPDTADAADVADGTTPEIEALAEAEPASDPEAEPASDPEPAAASGSAWGDADSAWGAPAAVVPAATEPAPTESGKETEPLADDGSSAWTASADAPRWADGDVPEGFPTGEPGTDENGEPVDRGAIMAALEAAAEAVVAAESAAESADQAEAAADLAETAAELFKGRSAPDEELDPEAAAAMSARVDAGGFEGSYADRLASLLPGHGGTAGDGEPRTTQVIVSGLVSVASIASFKRHLGRLAGVEAVAVASGPEGEFVFNVTHRPEVSFRDAVPTMPGFAARVTGTSDGAVQVTARDPEAEG